jgi:hypothetical protein
LRSFPLWEQRDVSDAANVVSDVDRLGGKVALWARAELFYLTDLHFRSSILSTYLLDKLLFSITQKSDQINGQSHVAAE